MEQEQKFLPSKFQNGSRVDFELDSGIYDNCEVIKVSFTRRKVLYDLDYVFVENREDVDVDNAPSYPGVETAIVTQIKSKRVRLYNIEERMLRESN